MTIAHCASVHPVPTWTPLLPVPTGRAVTIVVPDVRKAPSYGRLRHLAPTQGYQALLASPLRGSDDLAGVIVAYSVAARQFSGPELELINLLGGQAAMALETARLRTEQQEDHPGAVTGQRRTAPGTSRAGVGRAAAPPS